MDPIESLIPDDSGAAPALEPLAMVALDAGRMLMEAGASANGIDEIVAKFARGLGAERVDLRIGYASLAVTIGMHLLVRHSRFGAAMRAVGWNEQAAAIAGVNPHRVILATAFLACATSGLAGVLGGVAAFGFIGIFLGPTLLAVGYGLLRRWALPAAAP